MTGAGDWAGDLVESAGEAVLPQSAVLTTTRAEVEAQGWGAVAAELSEAMTTPNGFLEGDVDIPADGLVIEVNGRPKIMAAGPCEHRVFFQQFTVASITENADGTGPVVSREMLVKGRCGECGCPAKFDVSTVRQSSTVGELGVVVVLDYTE